MQGHGLPVRYRLPGGTPVVSVTQVLTFSNQIDDTWFTEESAWRGSVVHRLTEDFDAGRPLDIPSGLHPFIDAYAEFVSIVKPVYSHSEHRVMNPLVGLAGTIDRVCTSLFGVPMAAIVDFKTGPKYPWHAMQLAAYNALMPTGARFTVHLLPTGRYRLVQHDDPLDHRRFMHHLANVRGTVTSDGDFWIYDA